MEYGLTILAVCLFAYAVSSKRLSLTIFTGPLLFASLGWVTGPAGLDLVKVPQDVTLVTVLLEATLVLVLFTDAMGINTSRWRENRILFDAMPTRITGV